MFSISLLSGATPPEGRLCPAGQPRRDVGRCGDTLGSPITVGCPGSWGWGLRWLQGAWGGLRGRRWEGSAEMPRDAQSWEVMGPDTGSILCAGEISLFIPGKLRFGSRKST